MRINQLNAIYEAINAVFQGDKRPLDLAGILPIKIDDLRTLLLYSDLIDINGNLHYKATHEKFCFIICMYYSLRKQSNFTRPRAAVDQGMVSSSRR